MTTPAIGIYYSSEELSEILFNSDFAHFSEADLLRHLAIDPLFDVVERYKKRELSRYVAIEMFNQKAELAYEHYYFHEEISWEAFLNGEIPEFIYEDDWSWSIFTDDWESILNAIPDVGDTIIDAHTFIKKILNTSIAEHIYLIEWHQQLVYVYRSNFISDRKRLKDKHWDQFTESISADADCKIAESEEDIMIPTYVLCPDVEEEVTAYRMELDQSFDPSEMPSYAHPPETIRQKASYAAQGYYAPQ
tara:strand:- start:10236 stop:10979 length:744 start_codon:yes stop_codon:yes gene_type:complete